MFGAIKDCPDKYLFCIAKVPVHSLCFCELLSRLETKLCCHLIGESLKEIRNSWKEDCRLADIRDFRVHDLVQLLLESVWFWCGLGRRDGNGRSQQPQNGQALHARDEQAQEEIASRSRAVLPGKQRLSFATHMPPKGEIMGVRNEKRPC